MNELTAGQWLWLDEKFFRVTSGEAELYVVCKRQRKFLSTVTAGDFFAVRRRTMK